MKGNKSIILIVSLLSVLWAFLTMTDNTIYAHLTVGLFVYCFLNFADNLGTNIPVKDLVAVIAVLQWLMAPIWVYNNFQESLFYFMPLDEETYMEIMFPSTLAYLIGFNFNFRTYNRVERHAFARLQESGDNFDKIGKQLMIIGFIGTLGGMLVGRGSLNFVFVLIGNLKIIGAFYIFLSKSPSRTLWLTAGLSTVVIDAFRAGIFHDMIIWLGFGFTLYFITKKMSLWGKLRLMAVSFFLLFLLNSVKNEYRRETSENRLSFIDNISIFGALTVERIAQPDLIFDSDNFEYNVGRLNQGRIIGFIINNIPYYAPYVEGESIWRGIEGALLPRFLAPNKLTAGGYENFERFTGTKLPEGTSMDLSLAGEGYGNFGFPACLIFMFVMGMFYSYALTQVLKKSEKYASFALWVPYLFFYVIKAEADFGAVLNQFTKSLVIVVALFYFNRKLFSPSEAEKPTLLLEEERSFPRETGPLPPVETAG